MSDSAIPRHRMTQHNSQMEPQQLPNTVCSCVSERLATALRAAPCRNMQTHAYLSHLLDGAVQGRVTVLLVHVVEARPRHVPHPDAVVLHRGRLALKDLQTQMTG